MQFKKGDKVRVKPEYHNKHFTIDVHDSYTVKDICIGEMTLQGQGAMLFNPVTFELVRDTITVKAELYDLHNAYFELVEKHTNLMNEVDYVEEKLTVIGEQIEELEKAL
jgi:hypothetical protein